MKNNPRPRRIVGVVIMTYGSATTAEHVAEYMAHIYHGTPPEGIVKDFEERYRLVGRSPLIEITQRQAELIEKELNEGTRADGSADSAMLSAQGCSTPRRSSRKPSGSAEMRAPKRASASFSRRNFLRSSWMAIASAFERAAIECGFPKEGIAIAAPWPTRTEFYPIAWRTRQNIARRIANAVIIKGFPVIFTTHSLPKRVVEKDPAYLEQLRSTIRRGDGSYQATRRSNGTPGYQSAGHTPEEWLKPDMTDILADLKKKGDVGGPDRADPVFDRPPGNTL